MTLEDLKAYGANTEEGLARCLNNEAFYLRMVNLALADKNFDGLKQAMDAGDARAAFEAAHALKGVLGNLSLTDMFDKCSEITELLRAKTEIDYTPLINQLLSMRDELDAMRR
jgi:HPt (histidine-containing phosphotransfer) domain-containing protein